MTEEARHEESHATRPARPFLLMTLCVFALVFYGILGILLLAGTFYSGFFTDLLQGYNPGESIGKPLVILFFLGLALPHWASFTGALLIWKLKRKGYFLFAFSTLLIAVFHLFLPDISILVTTIHISLIILFGLFYNFYQL